MHIAGNDVKKKGPLVKHWLDAQFWVRFNQKMAGLQNEIQDVVVVVWGDYALWGPGCNDVEKASAAIR